MSRRIRVNLTRWVCRTIGHNLYLLGGGHKGCGRCGRFW